MGDSRDHRNEGLEGQIRDKFKLWLPKLVKQGHVPVLAIAIHPDFGTDINNWDMSLLVGKEVGKEYLLALLDHVANVVRHSGTFAEGGAG